MPGQQWEQPELPFEPEPDVPEGQLEFDFPEPLAPPDFEVIDAFDDIQNPTSTTNPERPRTLLAGYNRRSMVLTVMFRDGTLWDYGHVPEWMWQNFKKSYSKGWFLYNSGLDRWSESGPSNMATFSTEQLEYISVRARIAQVRAGGLSPGMSAANAARQLREDAAIKRNGYRSWDDSRISNPHVQRDKKRWGIPPAAISNPWGSPRRRNR